MERQYHHLYAVEEQVAGLFGWKPENAQAWLLSNPNDPQEQERNLLQEIRSASTPKLAASFALNAIYSRRQSDLAVAA